MSKVISVQKPYLGKDELASVSKVFESAWLGMGAEVKKFEDEVEKYLNAKYFVAVNTGTSAIHLALLTSGVGVGDEVIVPSLTFVASIHPIIYCGAKPVFCDVEPDTLNIDVKDFEKKITSKTKAVIPVHYSGQPADMDPLIKLAKKHKITVIEDAAHAFGSKYKNKKIGSFGDMTCFSFDPIKNITCGEGGGIATSNPKWVKQIIKKRIMGIDKETWTRYKNNRNWHYSIDSIGFRYHMSNINAAIGIVQLKRLNKIIDGKKKIVKKYDDAFKKIPQLEITKKNYNETAPFNYILKVKVRRQELIDYLKQKGIDTGIHYIPNHLQPFFKKFKTKLPVTEKLFGEILTLPLYYGMTNKDINKVIDGIRGFYA
ncbi:MAG: DegT/DnrJ/EryC1/StrS family aminotransferase [Armatimonadota bacterium]